MLKQGSLKLMIPIIMALIMTNLFPPHLLAAADSYSYQFEPNPNYTQSDIKALLKISATEPMIRVEWLNPQGSTADCHPQGGGCTIYNEYDGVGTLIFVTWEFFIYGQQRPSGTYTAIVTYCTSQISNSCISRAEMFRANFYIDNPTSYIYLPFLAKP